MSCRPGFPSSARRSAPPSVAYHGDNLWTVWADGHDCGQVRRVGWTRYQADGRIFRTLHGAARAVVKASR